MFALVPAIQVVATLVVLALPWSSGLKAATFFLVWALTFRRISRRELVCFVGSCVFFSFMDVLAVRQGTYRLAQNDIAGLPIWEFFIWGFLVLHILRILNGPVPAMKPRLVLPLAVLFAIPFGALNDPAALLIASGAILGVALLFFHQPWDIAYATYSLILGAAFEYVGVLSGQWEYLSHPPGGVELWFVTMWAGIGLFVRQLVVPLVYASGRRTNDATIA